MNNLPQHIIAISILLVFFMYFQFRKSARRDRQIAREKKRFYKEMEKRVPRAVK